MIVSAVRFTNYKSFGCYPSSELLGYYHSSALRTDKPTFLCETVMDCTPRSLSTTHRSKSGVHGGPWRRLQSWSELAASGRCS